MRAAAIRVGILGPSANNGKHVTHDLGRRISIKLYVSTQIAKANYFSLA